MRFTLDPGGDVVVPDGVTLAQCRDGLARLAGRPDLRHTPLAVDGCALPDDHVAGAPPWVPGAVLRAVGTAGRPGAPGPGVPAVMRRGDAAVAAARADWHVAVVSGPGTGEVHAPDPGGATVDLRTLAPSRPVVHHRAAGRVRGRRWWWEDRARRRRRLRPGARVTVGAVTVELRLGAGAPPTRARRRPGARPARPTDRSSLRPDGLAGRIRDLRTAVLQPTVAVPVVGSLVLAAVLRSPVLLLVGLVGPLAAILARRDPTGHDGRPAPSDAPRPGAGAVAGAARPVDGGSPDAPWRATPVRPPDAGTCLTDPAAAAVRAALTSLTTATPGAPAGTVEGAPWWRFAADGGLGVVGPAEPAAAAVRALLADALADPTLPLAVLRPADASWSWLRWVGPRLAGRSGARVGRTAAQAEEVLGGCTGRVLVLDAVGTARRPALHRWWTGRRSAAAGLVLMEERAADLPAWCPWVLDLSPRQEDPGARGAPRAGRGEGLATREDPHGSTGLRRAVLRGPDGSAVPVEVSLVTGPWAEQHARRCAATPPASAAAVAPVAVSVLPVAPAVAHGAAGPTGHATEARQSVTDDRMPRRVALGDLGLATDRGAIARAWAEPRPRRGLALALGADARGAVVVDLVRDGPHVLVAGTTGAGKSELLQTLLLSLALIHPPAEVSMVLVDYKGGAGFGRTRDLPHVAGMVTDLDPATAARALEGLRTELRRREELLAAADVTDVADLPRPPARVVVVVDEFRALVEDLPEFVPALVRLATQGRSLGVHLVLATQRPSGVVDAQLRANLPLRICLRVTDPGDSRDVVDVPDAAGIPATAPGRAVLARPGAEVDLLQTAWAALPKASSQVDARSVRPADPWSTWCPWRHPDVPASGPVHGEPSADVLDTLVAEVVAAHRAGDGRRPQAPWLPPLPEHVTGADVWELDGLDGGPGDGADGATVHVGHPLAVRDLPERRRRDLVGWDRSGTLAVVGGPGSGRTTTLRGVAVAALADGVDVHVLTAGPEEEWRDLAPHPGLGTVVGPEDPARALTLVTALLRPDGARRETVLCIDDAAGVVRALDLLPRAPGTDLLDRVLREARACGTAVALSTLPAEAHRLLRHVTQRVVLRVDDVHDALALGVPRTLWSAGTPPGRGVHLAPAAAGGPRQCQVVLPPPAPPALLDPALLRDAAAPHPLRIAPLPASVRLDAVAAAPGPDGTSAGGAPSPLLGTGGSLAGPVRMPLDPAALVVGPSSSGRTTALRTLATALRSTGHDVRDDPAAVLELLARPPTVGTGAVVLVDDVDLLLRRRPEAEDALMAWVDAAEEGRRDVPRLVVAARTDRVATAYRGLLAALRTTAALLVLAPAAPGSTEVAGVDLTATLDPLHPQRPGRGALVVGGRATRVQVAVP